MPKPTSQRSWKRWVSTHSSAATQESNDVTENLVQRHAHHVHQTEIHTVSGTADSGVPDVEGARIQSETEELEGEIALPPSNLKS